MNKKILFVAAVILALFVTVSAALAQEPAPVITSTPVTTAVVGQQYSYQVTNTPADNGELYYELDVNPTGMTISSTGLITWTPSSAGTFPVTVVVGDEDSQDEQSFSIIVTSVPAQFSANDVILGSSSQKRNENIVGQVWRVTNTGSEPINNIQLTLTGIDSKYQVTSNLPQTTLNGGESMDVLFNAFVPENQDAGRIRIGTAQLSGNGVSTLTKSVNMETENNLVINKIVAKVNGKKDTLTGPGTIDEDAELGDDIELEIEIENTFSENIEIEDITVELEASDLDPADGLDDEINSLDNGDDETIKFSFTLDFEDVDPQDAPFTITVKVEGEDENGATHGENWDIKLDMDVKSRDVRIISVTKTPSISSCQDNTIRMDYTLRNIGSRDLDDATVKFEIPELNFGAWERNIEIDEGDSESFSTNLKFNNVLAEGTYILEMTIYATGTSTKTDEEFIPLEVRCSGTSNGGGTTNNQSNGSGIDVNTGNVPVQVTGVPVASSTGTKSTLFKNADTYLIVLGLLVVVLLIVIVVLATRMIGRN